MRCSRIRKLFPANERIINCKASHIAEIDRESSFDVLLEEMVALCQRREISLYDQRIDGVCYCLSLATGIVWIGRTGEGPG